MGQIASVYARTPETKNENSASRMRKTGLSQPVKSPAERILFFQRTIGNQAVQRLIKSGALQAKLTVNPPGDIYEQEADRVARQVVSQINQPVSETTSQSVQRQEMPEEEEKELMKKPEASSIQRQETPKEEEKGLTEAQKLLIEEEGGALIQTKLQPHEEKARPMVPVYLKEVLEEWIKIPEPATSENVMATSSLETVIQGARGNGQPLADSMRPPMEEAFMADFSGVRVHTDAVSDMLNQSLHSRAFTTGQDIFFRQGEYNPGSELGKELIAHELTHVVQQNGSGREHLAEKGEKITNIQRRISPSKIDTISAKSLAAGNVIQLAYTARRPLKALPWMIGGAYHEHIFFEDGLNPPNIGFMGKKGLGQDNSTNYTQDQTGLNDPKMRQAVNQNTPPGKYSLLKNNCQHWVVRVLATYNTL